MHSSPDPSSAPPPARSGIILAGGRSRRMGRPKPWLPLGDAPLLVRVAALLRPLVDDLVVVAAAGQALPDVAARVVRDHAPDLGPLPALALGLESVATPYAFALACDGPFVRPALLRLLAQETAVADPDGVIPCWADRPQPLVAIYHRRLASTLATLARDGERRLQALAQRPGIRLLGPATLHGVDPDGASFRPLNTPEEWAAAEAAWQADRGTD